MNENDKAKFQEVYRYMLYVKAMNEPREIQKAAREDFDKLSKKLVSAGVSPLILIAWTQLARKAAQP